MTTTDIGLHQVSQELSHEDWKQATGSSGPTGSSLWERTFTEVPGHYRLEIGKLTIDLNNNPEDWLEHVAEAFERFMMLQDNWDSYGAVPIQEECIRHAVRLLDILAPLHLPEPAVVPTSFGGVQIEWHLLGIDLEIEVLPSLRLGASFQDSNTGEEWDQDVCDDFTSLGQALQRLAERHHPAT